MADEGEQIQAGAPHLDDNELQRHTPFPGSGYLSEKYLPQGSKGAEQSPLAKFATYEQMRVMVDALITELGEDPALEAVRERFPVAPEKQAIYDQYRAALQVRPDGGESFAKAEAPDVVGAFARAVRDFGDFFEKYKNTPTGSILGRMLRMGTVSGAVFDDKVEASKLATSTDLQKPSLGPTSVK